MDKKSKVVSFSSTLCPSLLPNVLELFACRPVATVEAIGGGGPNDANMAGRPVPPEGFHDADLSFRSTKALNKEKHRVGSLEQSKKKPFIFSPGAQ